MTVFDHAVVNVLGNMDEAVKQYGRLGFFLAPRGYHTLGSINHLAVFGDTYLELLGYAPGEQKKRAELWEHPAGLTGLAFRTANATALHSVMHEAGIAVEPCKTFSRPVEIDGASHEAAFQTFQLNRAEVANGRIFYCQHQTPDLIWRFEYQTHPNGVSGIAGAFIACTDPMRITELVSATPGLVREADSVVRAGDTRLHFASVDALQANFDGAALPEMLGQSMRMVALELKCRSLDQAAALFDTQGIPYAESSNWLQVGPAHAAGLILRFVPQD